MATGGQRAVEVSDHLYDQKSHHNPLSCLMEIVANAVEHGKARHVDTLCRRGYFAVTETGGVGLDPEGLERSVCGFGSHKASDDVAADSSYIDVAAAAPAAAEQQRQQLAGFSHNGIGTKAPLRYFNERLVLSCAPDVERTCDVSSDDGMLYSAAYLARQKTGKASANGNVIFAHWRGRAALAQGAAGATDKWGAKLIALLPLMDLAYEFQQIGAVDTDDDGRSGRRPARQGCRWIFWTDATENDGGTTRPFKIGRAHV